MESRSPAAVWLTRHHAGAYHPTKIATIRCRVPSCFFPSVYARGGTFGELGTLTAGEACMSSEHDNNVLLASAETVADQSTSDPVSGDASGRVSEHVLDGGDSHS